MSVLTTLYDRSTDWFAKTLPLCALASQTRSKAPGRVGPMEQFPLAAHHGDGAYLVDVDGNRFLDFVGANAAIPLGHNQAEVMDAVGHVLGTPLLSLPSPLEADVARKLLAVIPCAEQVRFVRTGSEATTGALLIAQAATERETVWVWKNAYHGWHPWAAKRPAALVGQYGLNNFEHLTQIRQDRPAAVFFEPPRFQELNPDWLIALREVTREIGAVLIFDELVAGFRLARAGGQEFYGVTPDLATYGKALGNGFAIACVCGRADLMQHAATTVSSTHGGERVGLAAASAVLDIYERDGIIAKLWRNGWSFYSEFAQCGLDPDIWLSGFPVHFRINWISFAQSNDVLTRCAARGVLFHRDACNASAAMTEVEARLGARILAEELQRVWP